jgi:hypothetical protein
LSPRSGSVELAFKRYRRRLCIHPASRWAQTEGDKDMAKAKASSEASGGGNKQASGNKGKGAERGGSAARSSGGGGQRGQSSGAAGSQKDEQATGTPDEHYNLVSVLYHSLKGAQIYSQYIEDAEEAGDNELADFLEDVREEEQRRAERAKALLMRRIGGGGGLADDEEA